MYSVHCIKDNTFPFLIIQLFAWISFISNLERWLKLLPNYSDDIEMLMKIQGGMFTILGRKSCRLFVGLAPTTASLFIFANFHKVDCYNYDTGCVSFVTFKNTIFSKSCIMISQISVLEILFLRYTNTKYQYVCTLYMLSNSSRLLTL